MKTINNYITERLHITKQTDIYNYFPKTREELRKILTERLDKDKNANLNDIDISKITDLGFANTDTSLFQNLDPHNIDISNWNTSNVTDMSFMFWGCNNLKCNISNWDVSNVENMDYMFDHCKNFDCDLGNWDVSNTKSMKYMFKNCSKFEGKGLENWDVSNVNYMTHMFVNCTSLKNTPSWYWYKNN